MQTLKYEFGSLQSKQPIIMHGRDNTGNKNCIAYTKLTLHQTTELQIDDMHEVLWYTDTMRATTQYSTLNIIVCRSEGTNASNIHPHNRNK